eukprot:752470-Hanusia_phi.AAC.2
MVSEGEALVNTLRDEMEKNSLLREQLSKKDAIIEVPSCSLSPRPLAFSPSSPRCCLSPLPLSSLSPLLSPIPPAPLFCPVPFLFPSLLTTPCAPSASSSPVAVRDVLLTGRVCEGTGAREKGAGARALAEAEDQRKHAGAHDEHAEVAEGAGRRAAAAHHVPGEQDRALREGSGGGGGSSTSAGGAGAGDAEHLAECAGEGNEDDGGGEPDVPAGDEEAGGGDCDEPRHDPGAAAGAGAEGRAAVESGGGESHLGGGRQHQGGSVQVPRAGPRGQGGRSQDAQCWTAAEDRAEVSKGQILRSWLPHDASEVLAPPPTVLLLAHPRSSPPPPRPPPSLPSPSSRLSSWQLTLSASGTSSKSDKVAPQRSSTSRHSMLEPAPTRPSLVPRLPVGDAMHKQVSAARLRAAAPHPAAVPRVLLVCSGVQPLLAAPARQQMRGLVQRLQLRSTRLSLPPFPSLPPSRSLCLSLLLLTSLSHVKEPCFQHAEFSS